MFGSRSLSDIFGVDSFQTLEILKIPINGLTPQLELARILINVQCNGEVTSLTSPTGEQILFDNSELYSLALLFKRKEIKPGYQVFVFRLKYLELVAENGNQILSG
jgi:hypothetical protein